MTTIAFKNGVLAADTAMRQGGSMLGSVVKIVRRNDGDMAGAAGNANYNGAFIKWFLAGEKDEPPKATESDRHMDRGVIFRKAGGIDVFEPNGAFRCEAEYYAFGSGMDYALGAMFAGAGAGTAVHAAVKHDPHSGGDVTVLHA